MSWTQKGRVAAFISPETWRQSGQAAYEGLRAEMEVRVKQLRYKGALLQEEERHLWEELNTVGREPESVLRLKRLYGRFWAGGFTLTLLGTFGLALWALRPFGLGWEEYAVAAVITMVAALGMEVVASQVSHLVPEPHYRRWILFLGFVGLLGAVTASTFLGLVRSEEMTVQGAISRQEHPAVIIEGEGPALRQGQHDPTTPLLEDFYRKLGRLSLLVMIPLAVAVELIGGIALHEALARIPPARTKLALLRRRRRLRYQMVGCASAIEACERQPEIAWNEFLQGGLLGERMRQNFQGSPGRFLVFGLVFLFLLFALGLLWAASSFAQEAVVMGICGPTADRRRDSAG